MDPRSTPGTRTREVVRIDRPMPRATRRRSRWLEPVTRAAEVLMARPPEPRADAAADEACYALLVDVPDAGPPAPASAACSGEEPCYALVVDVPDPDPDPDPGVAGRVVPLVAPPRPDGRPDLRPVGPVRPGRPREDRSRPPSTRPAGPRPHRPEGDRRLRGTGMPVTAHPGRPSRPAGDPPDGTARDRTAAPDSPPASAAPAPPLFDQDVDGAADGAPRVAVDPRIRARRIAVRRAEGRRRLRLLGALVGLLTVLTVGVVLVYSPLFGVERVDVTGVDAATAAAVRTAAGVSRGDALLRVDPGRVEARLEALPWIAHAAVSRDLPGTLRIQVTTRVAVGWVTVPPPKGSKAAATVAVVDRSGRVMQAALVPPAGLPQLVGPTARARPGSRIRDVAVARVAGILPADLRSVATTLQVQKGLATMGLDHGPEIRFGTPDALALKGRTALAILGSLTTRVHYIDVRVPSAPVTG